MTVLDLYVANSDEYNVSSPTIIHLFESFSFTFRHMWCPQSEKESRGLHYPVLLLRVTPRLTLFMHDLDSVICSLGTTMSCYPLHSYILITKIRYKRLYCTSKFKYCFGVVLHCFGLPLEWFDLQLVLHPLNLSLYQLFMMMNLLAHCAFQKLASCWLLTWFQIVLANES